MTRKTLFGAALLAAALASPAAAQLPGRHLSVEPFVGYGFYGKLPETSAKLEGTMSYGARAGLRLTQQWGVYGKFQRSTPELIGRLPFGLAAPGEDVTVDHWSAGLSFSYLRRGGAEGMLPLTLEAGVGQARYEDGPSDLALNLGVSSAVELSPNLALRYGLNDFVTNFNGDQGMLNQIFVRIGAELSI